MENLAPDLRTSRGQNGTGGSQHGIIEDLQLDRVVASQPEIGPTPPDGGYGWLIVTSAAVYHITVPALFTLYGLVILKAIREEDHEENEVLRIWDVNITLVPVISVVIKLLLESWCRVLVRIFNMPRFMALSGLCLTVAGVLLSSYVTDANSNDHIVSVFAGIFVGIGCALTGQQTEVIITHFFRDKLTIAQRIVRMAPSIGNCLIPILVGYLCTIHTGEVVVMIYGAILMQNSLFLASYTRPIYIEKVLRTTYNMLRAIEDEEEVVFSNNQNRPGMSRELNTPQNTERQNAEAAQDEDGDVVVFKSKKNAQEIMDPSIQSSENVLNLQRRFSSDFNPVQSNSGNSSEFGSRRFSSDFSSLDIANFSRINGYQELENIESGRHPQPLYRETTVDAPSNLVFATEMTPGTARRTASLKKNFITVVNMLQDLNFYLYALLHLCTTFCILILGVFFPAIVWERNPSLNIWSVCLLTAVSHASALCFILLCAVLPKSVHHKLRLCAGFCLVGTVGFYGITLASNRGYLIIACMFASFATAASSILQQQFYNTTLNDFDSTATITTSNAVVAIFVMIWSITYNYGYKECFYAASGLQIVTACVFFLASFRRRR